MYTAVESATSMLTSRPAESDGWPLHATACAILCHVIPGYTGNHSTLAQQSTRASFDKNKEDIGKAVQIVMLAKIIGRCER